MTDEIKLKAGKASKNPDKEVRGFAKGFKAIKNLIQQSKGRSAGGKRSARAGLGSSSTRLTHSLNLQRCSVRFTYSKNKINGQWAAHGKYLERESARAEENSLENGEASHVFGSADNKLSISETLESWQKAGDENMFKLIVSPEFGEQINLKKHTEMLMNQVQSDLGTKFEWVAVEHHNTEHPHVHIAVRGVDVNGAEIRLAREYIKSGLRARAQQAATAQLGYRSPEDRLRALEKQIVQQRFTDIDRGLKRKGKEAGACFSVDFEGRIPTSQAARAVRLGEIRRLQHLCSMGLATKVGAKEWHVDKSFEQVLRQMQVAGDRLKSIAEHKEMMSDQRLPLVMTVTSKVRRLSGRVLGTGLDEAKGQPYLLLEGVDSKVHYLYHDASIEQARRDGQMKAGTFVVLERKGPALKVSDRGNADALLQNKQWLEAEAVRVSVRRKELPSETTHGGWLGRYHQAVSKTARELEKQGDLKKGEKGYEKSSKARQR